LKEQASSRSRDLAIRLVGPRLRGQERDDFVAQFGVACSGLANEAVMLAGGALERLMKEPFDRFPAGRVDRPALSTTRRRGARPRRLVLF